MYYQKEATEVVKEFKTSADKGLTQAEAQKRLTEFGENVIRKEKKKSLLLRFASYFVDIFALLLIIGAVIAFIFGGETGARDAVVILTIVFINSTIGFIQEYRAEKIMEALEKVLPQKAVALRGGDESEILASQVVHGDILVLDEGDDIPVDCRIIEESELQTNDFTLTGESVPQDKFAHPVDKKLALADIDNMVFAGTSVASGNAKVVVTATGMDTEFGKIARVTQKIEDEKSPLQKELFKTGKIVAKICLIVVSVVFILNLLTHKPFSFSLVFALSLAVAMVPEGLPATVSIALALTVKKMAKRKALVKRLSAVETLGAATVICSDKTGTITKNEMTVKEIWVDSKDLHVKGVGYEPKGDFLEGSKKITNFSETLKEMSAAGSLCTNAKLIEPQGEGDKWAVLGDPTEGALITLAEKAGILKKDLVLENRELLEVPFTSQRKKMSVVVKNKKGSLVYAKGAPQEIINCCKFIQIGNEIRDIKEFDDEIDKKVDEFAKRGLRVLAVAKREFRDGEKLEEKNIEQNLIFLGLVGMIDPPKEGVREAVEMAHKAGIKVIMITGDYGLTAAAIAEKVSIVKKDYCVVTGTDLLKMPDKELINILKTKDVVFARTAPEQKIKIVSILKEQGEIVAVTGDGVNDAPALKKADIGVAMGIAGTDVSKEASEVILLDDNFKTIVSAIEEGRIVYDNLKKFVYFVFSANVGELFSVVAGIILGLPLPLLAIQILAIDLGVDVLPSLSLAVDPKAEDVMERPPRNQKERLLNKDMIKNFFYIGTVMGIGAALAFMAVLLNNNWGWGQSLNANLYAKATTVTYASLVLSQIVNLLLTHQKSIIKSLSTNMYLLGASLSSIMMLFAFTSLSFFQKFLGTHTMGSFELMAALLVALAGLIGIKARKFFQDNIAPQFEKVR